MYLCKIHLLCHNSQILIQSDFKPSILWSTSDPDKHPFDLKTYELKYMETVLLV